MKLYNKILRSKDKLNLSYFHSVKKSLGKMPSSTPIVFYF